MLKSLSLVVSSSVTAKKRHSAPFGIVILDEVKPHAGGASLQTSHPGFGPRLGGFASGIGQFQRILEWQEYLSKIDWRHKNFVMKGWITFKRF